MPILNSINQMLEEMSEWRQTLHQIPSAGLQLFVFQEHPTQPCSFLKLNPVQTKHALGLGDHADVGEALGVLEFGG